MANEEVTEQTTEQPIETTQAETPQPVEVTESAEPAEQPEWTPSYKYIFKGEEKEIDDPYFKSIIKDQESERKVRDLYERAQNMVTYKEKMAELEPKYQQINQKYSQLDGTIKKLAQYYDQDEMDLFIKTLGVDKNKLIQWVAKDLQYSMLPEDQKKLYDEKRTYKHQTMEMEEKLNYYKQKDEMEAVAARSFQLDNELGRADIQSVASQYDSIYGNGSFKQEVIRAGQFEWLTRGQDLSAADAVQIAFQKAKPIVDRLQGVGTNLQPSAPKPRIITNVAGNSSMSPSKARPRNLDELRAMAKQAASEL